MTTYPMQPQDLPAKNSVFIAYGAPIRLNNPATHTPSTFRPQTQVQYYRGLAIKGIDVNGDTAKVEFDPSSADLKHPIAANLDADDPLVDYLRQQHTDGHGVDIAIESIRKVKNGKTKDPIDPLAHISALRGATNPGGTDATTEATFANCRKMLVMVNGRPGKAIASDPSEWSTLVTNKDGTLPPEGWDLYQPNAQDWTLTAAIESATSRNANNGDSSMDAAAVENIVTRVVNAVLDARDASRPDGAHRVTKGFKEGMPWDVYANDGRINLGSYVAANLASTFRWAHTYLSDHNGDLTDAWGLTLNLAEAADRAQVGVYGLKAPERTWYSWTQAVEWAQWVVRTEHPYEHDADAPAWVMTVARATADRMLAIGERLTQLYAPAAEKKAEPAPAQPNTAADAQAPVHGMLAAIQAAWDDADRLRGVHAHAASLGLLGTVVTLVVTDDKRPVLTYPARQDGVGISGPVGSLIEQRGRDVTSAGPAEATTAPPAQTSAQAAPQQPQHPPATPMVAPDVTTLVNNINNADTTEALRGLYEQAKTRNLLGQTAPIRLDGRHVSIDMDRGTQRTMADVLLAVSAVLGADTPAPAPNGQGAPSAQQIADQANQATTASQIEELRRIAVKHELIEQQVTVGGISGALRAYLDVTQQKLAA